VVADGHHVDYSVIRISKRILGERLFLITDAVTESHQGHYQHRLKGDKYVLPDGTLSGSSLSMGRAVKNCVEKVAIPLDESLRMASLYPARAMGMDHEYGRIHENYVADMVELDKDLVLQAVFVGGRPSGLKAPVLSL
jgi:N-acetylglucosamine-6-phosphate deacetylase